MREKFEKVSQLAGGALLAYLMLRGCDQMSKDYSAKQAEIDCLCGKDRTEHVTTSTKMCMPDFNRGGVCSDIIEYATLTPTRK